MCIVRVSPVADDAVVAPRPIKPQSGPFKDNSRQSQTTATAPIKRLSQPRNVAKVPHSDHGESLPSEIAGRGNRKLNKRQRRPNSSPSTAQIQLDLHLSLGDRSPCYRRLLHRSTSNVRSPTTRSTGSSETKRIQVNRICNEESN